MNQARNLRSSEFFVNTYLKRKLAVKNRGYEDVIVKSKVSLRPTDKSYYKNSIKNCMTAVIAISLLKATILNNINFTKTICFTIISP